MSKFAVIVIGLLFLLALVSSAEAAVVHMHYLESLDVALDADSFQIFSFSGLEGENVTIVVYALEEGITPTVTLLDTEGRTISENLNDENRPVAVIEANIAANGVYTFVVSQKGNTGGAVRIMLVEGDPFESGASYLDNVDPFLPGRAYYVAGDAANPVDLRVGIVENQTGENGIQGIYASRGTSDSLPPEEERFNPVPEMIWQNDRGDVFYTLNVRVTPELVGGDGTPATPVLGTGIIQVDVGEGSDNPELINRAICRASAGQAIPLFAGPGDEYPQVSLLSGGAGFEILGESGEFYLITDPNSDTGGSWIPKSAVVAESDLTGEDCERVREVSAPGLDVASNTVTTCTPASGIGQPEVCVEETIEDAGGEESTIIPELDLSRFIVFTSLREENQEVFIMRADGSDERNVSNDAGADYSPAWSPDGTKVVFVSERDGNPEIYVFDLETETLTNISNNDAEDRNPVWSPDGSMIAFESNRDGNVEIYVVDASGENPRNVSNNPGSDTAPAWAAGGAMLAFTSDRTDNQDIFIVLLATGELQQLTDDLANDYDPEFSPNGKYIAFVSERDGNPELYLIDLTTGEAVNLTNNAAVDQNLSWSPDNVRIAFETDRDGNVEIYTLNINTQAVTNITNNPAQDTDPDWDPQPTDFIVFHSDRDGDFEIYVIFGDGTIYPVLTENEDIDEEPVWQPVAVELE